LVAASLPPKLPSADFAPSPLRAADRLDGDSSGGLTFEELRTNVKMLYKNIHLVRANAATPRQLLSLRIVGAQQHRAQSATIAFGKQLALRNLRCRDHREQ
jgi:hypothetical protein